MIRVFIGCSLDGFIAGPDHDIEWLNAYDGAEDTFTPFIAKVGAVVWGRGTYDVVADMEFDKYYGDLPILVATHRPLDDPRVRVLGGSLSEIVAEAQQTAGDKDVYLDGGALIRAALDDGQVDHMTVTVLPIVLGQGIALFAGCEKRHRLELEGARELGLGLVQLSYRVPRTSEAT